MTQSQGHAYLKHHTLSADALLLDLDEQARAVIAEARGTRAAHAARTLIKDGPLRVTIVGFEKDGALKEHKAGGPVAIQVLRGDVEIEKGGNTQRLAQHECLVLAAGTQHSVTAREQSAILVTIAMPA